MSAPHGLPGGPPEHRGGEGPRRGASSGRDALQARLLRSFDAGRLEQAEVVAERDVAGLGRLGLGLLDVGHCVLLEGRPVEWVDLAGGADRLFANSRTRQDVQVGGTAAGRTWVTTAQLQQHSGVSLGYVAELLEVRSEAGGLWLQRPDQRHSVSLLEPVGLGWKAWHLLAAQDRRGASAVVVTTQLATGAEAAAAAAA